MSDTIIEIHGDGSGRGVRVAVVDSGIDGSHPPVGGGAEYVDVVRDPDADETPCPATLVCPRAQMHSIETPI